MSGPERGIDKNSPKPLEAEVWVETVTDGGQRFMAACRKKRETPLNTARRRERQRDWGKRCIAHGSIEFCEATPIHWSSLGNPTINPM